MPLFKKPHKQRYFGLLRPFYAYAIPFDHLAVIIYAYHMGFPRRNSGRRFVVLALVDGRHSSDGTFPNGCTSAAIAEICDIGWAPAHHLLARQKKYGLVKAVLVGEGAEFRRALKGDRILAGRMPKRQLAWMLTPKGEGRLNYFGGHKKWCPICRRTDQ